MNKFERSKHVFRSDTFTELIKDTIRFLMEHLYSSYPHLKNLLEQEYMLYTILEKIHITKHFTSKIGQNLIFLFM